MSPLEIREMRAELAHQEVMFMSDVQNMLTARERGSPQSADNRMRDAAARASIILAMKSMLPTMR